MNKDINGDIEQTNNQEVKLYRCCGTADKSIQSEHYVIYDKIKKDPKRKDGVRTICHDCGNINDKINRKKYRDKNKKKEEQNDNKLYQCRGSDDKTNVSHQVSYNEIRKIRWSQTGVDTICYGCFKKNTASKRKIGGLYNTERNHINKLLETMYGDTKIRNRQLIKNDNDIQNMPDWSNNKEGI